MYVRQFLVVNSVEMDNPMFRTFTGCTYSESHLRAWAHDRWETPLNATLNVIARDIKQGGWEMFEYTIPADADPEPDKASEFLDRLVQSPESMDPT